MHVLLMLRSILDYLMHLSGMGKMTDWYVTDNVLFCFVERGSNSTVILLVVQNDPSPI
jgi:hypothetical protein